MLGGVDDVKDELFISLRETFLEVFLQLNVIIKSFARQAIGMCVHATNQLLGIAPESLRCPEELEWFQSLKNCAR